MDPLDRLCEEIDEWFEGDELERSAREMLDYAREIVGKYADKRDGTEPLLPVESKKYPRCDWQYQVANGDTNLGYRMWVSNQRLQED